MTAPPVSLHFLCRWLNVACPVSCAGLTQDNFHRRVHDGLILCEFLTAAITTVEFRGLNPKPRTKRAAVDNIEAALAEVWKRRGVLSARLICTAQDLFESEKYAKKVERFFQGLFETFVLREVRPHSRFVLSYFNAYLALFGWEFSEEATMAPCDSKGSLAAEFFSLVRLGLILCLLRKVDIEQLASHVFGKPESDDQILGNAKFVISALKSSGLPVLFDVTDFNRHGDAAVSELVLLQMHAIWESTIVDADMALPAPDDRETVSGILGLGNSISEADLSNLTFKDGVPVIREDPEIGSPRKSSESLSPGKAVQRAASAKPKTSLASQRHFVSIYGPIDLELYNPKTQRKHECRLTCRYLATSKQCTMQFWPTHEKENSQPFFVFDMRSMLDVLPYEDAQVQKAILLVVHSWGVMRDEHKLTILDDSVISLRLVPDPAARLEIIDTMVDLMERYNGKKKN